uniref:Dienelactone hydrolase family protein n=1 Tax=Eiseniibacteriota bacterium TaxID=2212470 RepID=A0A832ML31_UNCEI
MRFRLPSALLALALLAGAPRASAAAPAPALPPDEDSARAALDASPRHGELIDVPMPEGGAPIRTWIVYPERKDRAGVVVVIHEIYGLSDWIRGVADRLAADGFIAVAPDLVSGLGPGGGGTDSAASRDDVVKLVRGLTPDMTRARLDAVTDWATKLPAANGRAATIGFCWGGSRSFEYAASRKDLAAAVVYYGGSPDSATLAAVRAPVAGFYGGDDARVNATIEPARAALARLKRPYEVHVYDGAGHGFLRQQQGREGANLAASRKAWPRTLEVLRKALGK